MTSQPQGNKRMLERTLSSSPVIQSLVEINESPHNLISLSSFYSYHHCVSSHWPAYCLESPAWFSRVLSLPPCERQRDSSVVSASQGENHVTRRLQADSRSGFFLTSSYPLTSPAMELSCGCKVSVPLESSGQGSQYVFLPLMSTFTVGWI